MARDKDSDGDKGTPAPVEKLDVAVEKAEEKQRKDAERQAEQDERDRAARAAASKPDRQYYRVDAEQIGHSVVKPASAEGPVVIAPFEGLRRSKDPLKPTIVTVDDLAARGWHGQLARFIRVGALVPVIPVPDGKGGTRWLDVPSHDQVGPHAVQE